MFFEYKANPNDQISLGFPDKFLIPNSPKHNYLSIFRGIGSKGVDFIREIITPSFRVNHHFRPYKETLLHASVTLGRLDCVEYLYENRANVNSKNEDNQTPLHYAIILGRTEIAAFLIGHGADIAIEDINKNTPESIAYEVYDTIPKEIEEGFKLIHWLSSVKVSEMVTNYPESSDESDDDESYYDEICGEMLDRIMRTRDTYKGFLF